MITLADIFEQLTYGELKQVTMGGYGKGGISEEDFPELISHLNRGMIALYARFPIKENEVAIQQYDHITTYELNSKYSLSKNDPSVAYKYIIDTVENPFQDNVMRIDTAYDELGAEVPVNDYNNTNSIYTPTYDSIQIPFPVGSNTTFIVYRANHINIPLNSTDTSIEIDLPTVLVEALLSYIASRVHASRTSSESAIQESINLLAKYERICMEVEQKNLLRNAEIPTNVRIDTDGWA